MKLKKKKKFSLGSFEGEISAPRVTILPQSPSSLFPGQGLKWFWAEVTWNHFVSFRKIIQFEVN